jgi:MSHA biogenesis protein MshQ
MTIEAQNAAAGGNTRTENFRGGFVTLDPATELTLINSVTSGAYNFKSVSYNQNFDSGNYGEAVLALQFRWDMGEQAPTTTTVQNTAVTDEVTTLAGAPVSIGDSPTRHGRAVVGTAAGSELVDLDVVMRTEYYLNSTSGYVVNSDDFCNSNAVLSLSNFTDNLSLGETCVQDSGNPGLSGAGCAVAGPVLERYDDPLIAGDANLFLRAPGAGNDGSAILGADVPDWLEFDWDTGVPGTEDPIGHITFGIYGGDKNQVYRRELY